MMTGTDGRILEVSGVSRAFEGVRAVEDVTFSVTRGQIKALIGPNGAGKTTLLNVINGFLTADKGRVSLRGQDLTGLRPDVIAMLGLSRTFQLIRLFTVNNATVLDNVMIGAHKSLQPSILGSLFFRKRTAGREREVKERAIEMLKFVGLDWASHMPPGALPFGSQRLVELARSLMAEPDVLLLDEPASGLNDTEVEAFTDLLAALRAKGITILLVEHNMKLVMRVSDDIVVLDFGKKLAEGSPGAICSDQAVIEAYLGSECRDPGGTS